MLIGTIGGIALVVLSASLFLFSFVTVNPNDPLDLPSFDIVLIPVYPVFMGFVYVLYYLRCTVACTCRSFCMYVLGFLAYHLAGALLGGMRKD